MHEIPTCLSRASFRGGAVIGLALSFVCRAHAQFPLAEDFNVVANGSVYALVPQPDGKLLMGGSFTTLAGQTNDGVARLNADGSLDRGFFRGSGSATPWVYSLALQPDGKVLVGGTFTTLGGQPCTNFGRLLHDGTLDRDFKAGADGMVLSIVLQPDGDILVAGNIRSLGGQPCTNMGRLNAQGALDGSFKAALTGTVYSMAVQPDRKILAGGIFQTENSQSNVSLMRLNRDGSVDRDFSLGTYGIGVYGASVWSIALQRDGRILAGGSLTSVDGLPRHGIARLNTDGTPDESFDAQLENFGLYSPIVFSIVVQADGRIFTGGLFATVAGQACTNIARLNPDGTLDASFDRPADAWMGAVALQADGKVLLSEPFGFASTEPRVRLTRLSNSAAAVQNLSCSESTITWQRSGASPEVGRTTFEISTNGTDWAALGAGAQMPGGWELTNVSLPTNGVLRARGFTTGGYQNASSSFVETLLDLEAAGNPMISMKDGRFGVTSNGFGFTITGSSASSVVVEASTNLMQWLPIETNYFGSGSWHFTDPNSPNFPQRIYRVQQWP